MEKNQPYRNVNPSAQGQPCPPRQQQPGPVPNPAGAQGYRPNGAPPASSAFGGNETTDRKSVV